MKRLAIVVLSTVLTVQGEIQRFSFRPGPSNSVELLVDKTGALSGKRHRFVFETWDGTLELDSTRPAQSHVRFRIASASIACKDTWVSANDLKKIEQTARVDMLAVSQFPSIDFASTTVEQLAGDQFRVTGNLTIRDKTKSAVLTVQRAKDIYNGRAVVRLTEFGLKPPSAAFGLVGTKDEMLFQFNLSGKQE